MKCGWSAYPARAASPAQETGRLAAPSSCAHRPAKAQHPGEHLGAHAHGAVEGALQAPLAHAERGRRLPHPDAAAGSAKQRHGALRQRLVGVGAGLGPGQASRQDALGLPGAGRSGDLGQRLGQLMGGGAPQELQRDPAVGELVEGSVENAEGRARVKADAEECGGSRERHHQGGSHGADDRRGG